MTAARIPKYQFLILYINLYIDGSFPKGTILASNLRDLSPTLLMRQERNDYFGEQRVDSKASSLPRRAPASKDHLGASDSEASDSNEWGSQSV